MLEETRVVHVVLFELTLFKVRMFENRGVEVHLFKSHVKYDDSTKFRFVCNFGV